MQAPLLDANFLDQLCLSDELWAKVEVPDVKGRLNYLSHQTFICSVSWNQHVWITSMYNTHSVFTWVCPLLVCFLYATVRSHNNVLSRSLSCVLMQLCFLSSCRTMWKWWGSFWYSKQSTGTHACMFLQRVMQYLCNLHTIQLYNQGLLFCIPSYPEPSLHQDPR